MGSNLCTSATLGADSSGNANRRIVCEHARLAPNTWYSFTVKGGASGVLAAESAPNSMSSDVVRVFKTSSVDASVNTTPPSVLGTSLLGYGTAGFPTNGKIRVYFPTGLEGDMATIESGAITNPANVVLQAMTSGSPSGANLCASACTLTWDSSYRQLTVAPSTALAPYTEYALTVKTTAKNIGGQALTTDARTIFRTATSSDVTQPRVTATVPATIVAPAAPSGGATGVSVQTPEVSLQFSEPMDITTLTASTVKFCRESGGDGICDDGELVSEASLARRYDPIAKMYRIGLKTLLATGSRYCIQLPASPSTVKDANGVAATGTAYCFTTQSSFSDTTPPTMLFGQADTFKIILTFSEPVDPTTASTCGNYTLTIGGGQIGLGSATCTYRPETRTVEITGIGLPANAQWKVVVSANLKDL
jgi:hypothetical protein